MSGERGRRGITLTEVIVVAAILAILSGIVFSVVGGSIRKSKVTVSAENLRQVHAAQMFYEQDHGDLPLANYYRPGFQIYFKGSAPEPPLAPPKASRQGMYLLEYGYHLYGTKSYPSVTALDKECIDRRGESLAIAFDDNFRKPQYVARSHESFYLFIRRGGSIAREVGDTVNLLEAHPNTFPCPGAPEPANFR